MWFRIVTKWVDEGDGPFSNVKVHETHTQNSAKKDGIQEEGWRQSRKH
jgi:hypothetical protein